MTCPAPESDAGCAWSRFRDADGATRKSRRGPHSPWPCLALCSALVSFGAAPPARGSQAAPDRPEPRYEVGAEIRIRAETRDGIGDNPAREDGFAISRLRLNLTFRPSRDVTVFLQPQDSRVAGLASGRNPRSARDRIDLRQAYVAIGRDDGPLTLYAGRRELDFLDARLLGRRNWHNISPTWDGSMLTVRRGEDRAHLLAFSQVDVRDGFNVPSRTRFIYGAIGTVKSWAVGHVIEPFFLTTRRPIAASSNLGGLLRTAGIRISGLLAQSWDYQVLLAGQGGGETDSPQKAWAGVWAVGKTIERAPASPRIGFEWSYASGDRDPLDGRTGTFDTLFPSPHRIYGEQDIVGFRNVRILKSGVGLRPRKDLRIGLDFLDFRLASRRDGVYQTNFGRRIAAPPGGAASDSIGSELDLVVRYQPAAKVELRFGVSRFFAGEFVAGNLPGGESQTFLSMVLTIQL